MGPVETIDGEHCIAKIYQEEDSGNPREEWDNVGKMICFHSRYQLGDKHEYSNPDKFLTVLKDNPEWLILPLFLYDHSGITMSTSAFSCPWDSGQVGVIYCTPEQIQEEWGGDRDKARQYLIGEVETYDQYLTGDVYGIVIEDHDGNELDACWGFYGMEYAKQEAQAMLNTQESNYREHLEGLPALLSPNL